MYNLEKLLDNEQNDNAIIKSKAILELSQIVRSLCEELSGSVLDFGAINNKLGEFYEKSKKHPKKLLYSEVTKFVFDNYNNPQNNEFHIEILQTNLSTMYEGIVTDEGDHNVYEIAIKLYDHVMLAWNQIACIKPIQDDNNKGDYTSVVETILNDHLRDDVIPKVNTLDDKVKVIQEETEKTVRGLQSQIITILSIFTAVVFAFFGGVSFLDGALKGISDCRFYKVALITIICGFVIFNTVVVLLKVISKIIDKNIELPRIVVFVNITLIVLFLMISIFWFFDVAILANWLQNLISSKLLQNY